MRSARPRCLAFIGLIAAAPAAAAFEARILRPDGSPIAGAEVSILGRSGVARSDDAGRFVWQPDPAPPFEVLVVLPGAA